MPGTKPAHRAPLWWAAAIALAGFADAAYLTVDHYITLPLPCTILHGCEKVLTSPWSMVGPIPLAAFGVAFYLFALFAALYLATAPALSRLLARAFFGLTLIGLLFSVAFESIQAFIIRALCMYCAGSALATLLLFICGMFVLRRSGHEFAA
ncbi:MAG: vitamin K epoxide reductase family protein [Patescibacteria group bacterium]|nr:vitamin K epoxide reductase family protein [Patescibacteria group bacterium]MDE1944138.1 vitamin K epoxide reductase family protein [Patescibacteria group bacterium]MDE1944759.1 vitamin K epoxide reductase family protein [Patescibacteria group bacterium]MDE2058018.1 vitamin K epoxide reductase family protein [Patescibacteria group bacterium]